MPDDPPGRTVSFLEWLDDIAMGVGAYYFACVPVIIGICVALTFLIPQEAPKDPVAVCLRGDAFHYVTIMRWGYSYAPDRGSMVAFFPAYPLSGRWLGDATGLDTPLAGLVTANIFMIGAFVLLARWVRVRWKGSSAQHRALVLLIFGLWPTGLFFRMPYAESLFFAAMLLAMYGMEQRWPVPILAVLAGFVTSIRPVGVAVTIAFTWHVLAQPGQRLWVRAGQAAAWMPVACGGLLAFMVYQQIAFGTWWGFAQTQEHWSFGAPANWAWQTKAWSLLTLEPIRNVYEPSSPRYWKTLDTRADGNVFLSLMFWNPMLFLLSVMLLVAGRWKQWVTGNEFLLGICLLGIPYVTRAYEMSMASHGRFTAVIATNYVVIGRALSLTCPFLQMALCAIFATLLCLLSCLYAANYLIF